MEKLQPDQIVAVVLAGGLGTRIQHLLRDLPKPMAPVAGRPCVEWILRQLAKQGIRRAILSTGYLAEVVEQHFANHAIPGLTVRCVAELSPLGTAGGFLHAAYASGETAQAWLVLNGDTIAFADIARATNTLNDPAISGTMFAREVPDTSRYGSLVLDGAGNLVRFEEKRPGRGLISTGVYLFRDALVRTFPNRTPLSLERDVFPALTSSGTLLRVLPMDAPFLDIGTPESLIEGDKFVREHLAWFELSGL